MLVNALRSKLIRKEEGEIRWDLPAVDIWRQIRAYQPWPGGHTRWRGRQLKVLEATPLPMTDAHPVGRVVALANDAAAFGVTTGDGLLGVVRVQLEGKRVMTAADFRRGQRDCIGEILPSD